ncbi:HlyD family secretion protein [Leptolyngbya sp. 15MV]|nr:HlyD family secretion protein [Leptolyngbya sp. 15MV]
MSGASNAISRLARGSSRSAGVDLQIARKTVAAPVAGTILKRNVEPGQFVAADPRQPAIVLGDLSTLHVRARVDEEDIPMLQPGASAIARVRGRAEISIPLTMIRIEPLVEPKTQLTGSTTERVDTRGIEVLFRVNTPADGRTAPMFPGQNVYVFIDGAGAGR